MVRSFFRHAEGRRAFAPSRMAFFALLLGILAQFTVSTTLAAQNASVIGVVKDSSGAPLANVQVVASGSNRSALTDERGEFLLQGLPAGTYHLDLVRIGYASAHQVVTVPPSGEVRVAIVMHVATVRLSSVNVTATPTGSDPLDVTQATVQLGGKELQRALSTSIGQTLAKEPGMASRFNGPMAATPVIRGLTGERVLVLQDGERTGDLSSAAADHMNAVDPSSAERIEVIRGPGSLLYGNNALGGVVNVISADIPTNIPSKAPGYIMGQGESATPGGVAGVGLTMPISPRFALTARGGCAPSATCASVVGTTTQYQRRYAAVHRRWWVRGPETFARWRVPADGFRVRSAARSRGRGGPHRRGASRGFVPGHPQHRSHRIVVHPRRSDGAELSARRDRGGRRGRYALQSQHAVHQHRGALARRPREWCGGCAGIFRQYTPVGEEAFTPAADNTNLAAFVFQEFSLSGNPDAEHAPRLQLGARYDRFTIDTRPGEEVERFGAARTRDFDNVAASVGLSIPVTEGVSLSGNVSRGFRAPAVEELYADGFHAAVGTYDVGNPNLKAERSTGLEAGLRAQSPRVFAQLNGYYNRIDDYITPIALAEPKEVDGEEVPSVTFEGRNAVLAGVEAQVESKLVHHLVGGFMGDYTRASIRGSDDVLPYIPPAVSAPRCATTTGACPWVVMCAACSRRTASSTMAWMCPPRPTHCSICPPAGCSPWPAVRCIR